MIRILQAISAWLAKWTPAFIAGVAVATYFMPGAFAWVRGYTQTAVLGVIMLTMGMTLKDEDFRILASRPLDMVVGALARFTQPKRRTISIEVGMQNAGLATVLAGKHFPAMPEAAVASAVSCVWHSVSGALLAGIFNAADSLFAGKNTLKKISRKDIEVTDI